MIYNQLRDKSDHILYCFKIVITHNNTTYLLLDLLVIW